MIFVLALSGINISKLIVAGGFIYIIIGLATQKLLGNMFSGIFLIEQPLKIGQIVNTDNITGFIEEIRFLSTIVHSFEGHFIRLPNELVFNSVITNFQENVARGIDFIIDIRYSDNNIQAANLFSKLFTNHPYIIYHCNSRTRGIYQKICLE